MSIKETAVKMKEKAPFLAASAPEVRNQCLKMIVEGLEEKKNEIFAANALDMEEAEKAKQASTQTAETHLNDSNNI